MTGGQKFCLRWDGFRSRLSAVFDELRRDGELLDVTLCCDGGHMVQAHRILLSASSPCLRKLLKEHPCQHPVFFLKDTSSEDLRAVIEFVYNGEVNVSQTQLASFIKTADMLQIKGLSGDSDVEGEQTSPKAGQRQAPSAASTPPPPAPPPPPRSPPPAPPTVHATAPPARPASRPADTAGQPPTKRPRHAAAAVAASGVTAAAAAAAAGSGAAPAVSSVIKTEQVDLSEDDGAALEETLARLSSFEDHDSTGASSQLVIDSSAASGATFPTLDVREDMLALGSASGAATGREASLTGSARKARETYTPMRDLRVLATSNGNESFVLDDARPPSGRTSTSKSAPLASLRLSDPELDTSVLPPAISQKLQHRIALDKQDWRITIDCIYREFEDIAAEIGCGKWHNRMAISIINQFPYLFPNVGLHKSIEIVRTRLMNKFKNCRRSKRKNDSRAFLDAAAATAEEWDQAQTQDRQEMEQGETAEQSGTVTAEAEVAPANSQIVTLEDDEAAPVVGGGSPAVGADPLGISTVEVEQSRIARLRVKAEADM